MRPDKGDWLMFLLGFILGSVFSFMLFAGDAKGQELYWETHHPGINEIAVQHTGWVDYAEMQSNIPVKTGKLMVGVIEVVCPFTYSFRAEMERYSITNIFETNYGTFYDTGMEVAFPDSVAVMVHGLWVVSIYDIEIWEDK